MKKHLAILLGILFFVAAVIGELPSVAQAAGENSPQISLSGEIRTRLEDASTPNVQSRETVLMRTRLNVDAKLITNTRVYVSLQDSRQWGQETNTTTTGNEGQAVDLSQAWFQVDKLFGQPLSVKVGRQVLAYGDQRLIGHLEWSNFARRFDAAKLMYDTKDFSADFFYSKIAEPLSSTVSPAPTERDSFFSGLYATVKSIPNNTIDLYVLNDRNDTSKKDEFTYGGRVNGKISDFDYTGELAFQSGDWSNTTAKVKQEAHAYAAKAGYTIPSAMGLRIGAEYDYATGATSDATKHKAFDNLYPTNHYLYGFTDDVNWSNIKAFSVNAGCKPLKDLWVGAEYWDYKLAQANTAGATNLGSEFNLMVRYSVNANVKLEGTWARRTAGPAGGSEYSVGGTAGRAIKDGDSSDLMYLQAIVTF